MSLIQRTIRALRGRFSHIDLSEKLDDQRMEVYTILWDMYQKLRGLNAESLESENLEMLAVHILPLDLTHTTEPAIPRQLDPGAYFIPLSDEFVRHHSMDIRDPETQEDLDITATLLKPGYSKSNSCYRPLSSYSKAGILCDRLAIEMSTRRVNCEEEWTSLSMITKWRWNTNFHLDPTFSYHAPDYRDDYDWSINLFYACSSHPTFPHIKVLMYHSDVKDPELVLKAEVMAIVATMHSRLCTETLLDHLIVPVMLFSFAGCSVRVLIAIYDGQNLRISMSKFMEYSEGSQDLWDLLTRYLGCGINHQLTTKKLPVE
ncbi:hypothetical protein BDV38DRAFT_279885 [Aspergillus pseudotamarii]|uniref:Uncharacterized protein n=1 Tax=Aspergillus pseudotamarii TaxID=132259 RepID=A0A5N6T3M6_ASPPS|nr:uncharacterized protein BDV38DRAFT_279885 [Aspergillus pseudotamarii]KAE8140910.1 hypothetical protein BDV38DRAFT_279885 [Aspergillus pseudotamarii]